MSSERKTGEYYLILKFSCLDLKISKGTDAKSIGRDVKSSRNLVTFSANCSSYFSGKHATYKSPLTLDLNEDCGASILVVELGTDDIFDTNCFPMLKRVELKPLNEDANRLVVRRDIKQ